MIVEFQVSAAKLAAVLRNRFIATALCFPQENANGLFLEHIEYPADPVLSAVADPAVTVFTGPGQTQAIAGTRVGVAQTALAFVASRQEVVDAKGAAVANPAFTGTVTVSLTLHAEVVFDFFFGEPTGVNVVAKFAGIDFGTLGSALTSDEQNDVATSLQAFEETAAVDIGGLADFFFASQILNAGIALDASASFVSLRLELGASDPGAGSRWHSFYGGSIVERLGGRDFAFVLDSALITETVQSMVQAPVDAAAANPDPTGPKLSVGQEPVGTWLGASTDPAVLVTFDGDITGACGPIDIGIDASLLFEFSVVIDPIVNKLRTTVTTTWDLDAAGCELAAGLLGVVAGAALGSIFGPLGAVVGGGLGLDLAVGSVILAVHNSSVGVGKMFAMPACKALSTGFDNSTKMVCDGDLPAASSDLFGTALVDSVAAAPDAMMLRGNIKVALLVKDLTVTVQQPQWQSQLNCGTHQEDVWLEAFVDFNDVIYVGVCEVSIATPDPLNAFAFDHAQLNGGQHITMRFDPADAAAYHASPYGVTIIVKSSSGARAVAFDAVPPIPPVASGLELGALVASQCYLAVDQTSAAGYNVRWVGDPGPDDAALHDWTVTMQNVVPGDQFTLSAAGQTLVAVRADGPASVVLATVVGRGVDAVGLTLRRHAAAHSRASAYDPRASAHRIRISQRLLVREDTLDLPGTAHAIAATGLGMLVVVTDLGVQAFALRTPLGARLVGQLAGGGYRGALALGSRVVVYGERGLALIGRAPAGGIRVLARTVHPVAEAVVRAGRIYARSGGAINVYDRRLTAVGRTPHELDSPFPTAPPSGPLDPLGASREPWTGLAAPAASRVVARPWWEETVRAGALYVHLDRAAAQARVYSMGAKRTF